MAGRCIGWPLADPLPFLLQNEDKRMEDDRKRREEERKRKEEEEMELENDRKALAKVCFPPLPWLLTPRA